MTYGERGENQKGEGAKREGQEGGCGSHHAQRRSVGARGPRAVRFAISDAALDVKKGRLRYHKPERGVCEDCGALVEPEFILGRWHVASVCGELWHGHGFGPPQGCLGKRDYAEYQERLMELDRRGRRQRFAVSGIDALQAREAYRHGPVMESLRDLKKPMTQMDRMARADRPKLYALTEEEREINDLLGLESVGSDMIEPSKQGVTKPYAAFLQGGFGTGKTTQLILACLHYLRLGWSVRYVTQDDLISSLRKGADVPQSLAYWNRFDLLAIDELGFGLTTDWQRARIFSIVDARYRSKKPLIVASNYSIQDMISPHRRERAGGTVATMTPFLGQRTVDRLLEMTGVFPKRFERHLMLELSTVWRRA